MTLMTFDDFMMEVLARKQAGLGRDQRPGQFYMNVLWDVNPRLHEKVRGSKNDPFFQDQSLPNFLIYLAANWND